MTEVGVVWVGLGTPDSASQSDVRRFLREFLRDRRIVEMNPVAWRAMLELFILPRRARISAGKYASIWYETGSPLLVHTQQQMDALEVALSVAGIDVHLRWAVRYGHNSVASVLDDLRDHGVRKVLIVPGYPHYSQTTVGSVYDAVARHVLDSRDQFELRFVHSFADHPMYIEALAQRIAHTWEVEGRPNFGSGDVLLLSYHGIPVSMAKAGDPYAQHCQQTTDALRTKLNLSETACRVTYQSKFGPAPWLTPATIDTVRDLGRSGTARVDIVCPGFTADCLETLEEINIVNREALRQINPDAKFVAIPCLNADPAFIGTLVDLISTKLAGWI